MVMDQLQPADDADDADDPDDAEVVSLRKRSVEL